MTTKKLESLRGEMEAISVRVLEALNDRARQAQAIAAEKRRLRLPVRDGQRETDLLERLTAANSGPFDGDTVRALFRDIVDACVGVMGGERQRRLLVGADVGPRVVVEAGPAVIGGATPVYLAGPCAIESEQQLDRAARGLAHLGVKVLRGGAFKPRTSPYDFQGLGEPGLRMLRDAGRRYGMATATEVPSPDKAELVARYADLLQVGARNMFNYDLLRAVGATGRPVLLKRGFGATVREWLLAAEYVALAGTDAIILCERGIRTFVRETRNTLDVSAVPLALAESRLPVIVDVSHAAGRRDLLAPLARAALAAGAHGLMVEVHPDPDAALSDAEQQLTIGGFARFRREVAHGLALVAARALDEIEAADATGAAAATGATGATHTHTEEVPRATQRCV